MVRPNQKQARFSLKLFSWKNSGVGNMYVEKSEVGTFTIKLERTDRSSKCSTSVLSDQKLSNFGSNFLTSYFPTSQLFQLHARRKAYFCIKIYHVHFEIGHFCYRNNPFQIEIYHFHREMS